MLNTIKFFSRYKNEISFGYEELEFHSTIHQKEIAEIIQFLTELEKTYSKSLIYMYYFREFFTLETIHYTHVFDLIAFLDFACTELELFKKDILHELKTYC